jgi:hypothetical protein
MHPNQSGFPNATLIVYQRVSGSGTDSLFTVPFYPLTGLLLTLLTKQTGLNPSPVFGMEAHASLIEHEVAGGIANFASPMWYTRLGASSDGHARYHITVDTTNEKLLILYQNGGAIVIARMNSGLDTFEQAVTVAPSGTYRYEALDIVYSLSGHVYYMSAGYSGKDQRESLVRVSKLDATSLAAFSWAAKVRSDIAPGLDFYPRTYTHGCLAIEPLGTDVLWMVHDAGQAVGYDPELVPPRPGANQESVRDRNTGLHYGKLQDDGASASRIGTDRMLPHHRLASKCKWVFDDLPYACVQQWHDCTPYTDDVNTNWDATLWPSVLGAANPRSTVLAAFDHENNVVSPVAVLDPGSSKTCEYAESEFQVHLPSIFLKDLNEFTVINRVVVTAEDLSLKWSVSADNVQWLRLGSAEHPSEAMCRVYRISKGSGSSLGISSSPMGDGVFLSAAAPLWFDGRFFGEVGPLDQPEIIDVRDSRMEESTANGTPPRCRVNFDGLDKNQGEVIEWRKIQVVVGYYDASGNKHRSAPSSVVYVDNVHGEDPDTRNISGEAYPANWRGKSVTIYFTMPLSFLPSDLEYFVEAYVSDSNDDEPVLVDTATIDLSTTPSVDEVSIEVSLVRFVALTATGDPWAAELELPRRTAKALYTAGGELPADPWPAFTRSATTSTRLMALDATNKGKVLVSKRFADFIAPEYNSLLDINLGDERDLLCIGKMDDKTVIFEKDDIHVIYGDGPENNGQGEDFAVHYISTDVGCEDQESIVECPLGLVFFRKERGFYLLDRQLNIKYIGDKVHDLSQGIDVIAAELVSYEGQVRFLCAVTGTQNHPFGPIDLVTDPQRPPVPLYGNKPPSSDFALVWDYEKDQWSVFANYPGAASTIHQGRYTRLLSDWSVLQERESTSFDYTDPTGDNRTLVRTPWIPIGESNQGYSVLHRMLVFGRYLSSLTNMWPPSSDQDACDIQVKIWYDYEEGRDVSPQTKLFRYQDFAFDPFSKRGIRAERLQFGITPAEGRGRCQAVKLEFEEVLPDGTATGQTYRLGQGFEISSIDFEIGVDQRVTRLLPQAVLK